MVHFLLIICICLCILYKLCSPSEKMKKYGSKIPGAKAYPIIAKKEILEEHSTKYGPVARLWFGKQLFIFLTDPSDIEIFLTSNVHLNKSESYRLLDSWLGKNGLVTSEASIWRKHRKLLTPCFHLKFLEQGSSVILRNAKVLRQQLASELNHSEFNIEPYVQKCVFDILCETIMGTRLNTQTTANTQYLDCFKTITSIIAKRGTRPWLFPGTTFRLSQDGATYFKALKIIKNFAAQMIMERKQVLEENQEGQSEIKRENDAYGKKKSKPFLDFLLTTGNFSDEEIEDEVQTFLFAGHDTTTCAISFCLYALATHQDVQNRLVNEINDAAPIPSKLTIQTITNLKFLDCVVKESLRLYTVVPIISRKVEEDIILPSEYILPSGCFVNFNLFHMHHNETYFPNPNKFIPERFETSNDVPNHFSFIPFSAGPRNCIGQKFALLEIKIILSIILLQFKFLPPINFTTLILDDDIVLRSLNKIPVRITNRE